jgi:gluconolactonase
MRPVFFLALLFLNSGLSTFAGEDKTNSPTGSVLISGEEWQLVVANLRSADGVTANASGDVFFSDRASNCIYRISLNGTLSVFKQQAGTGGLIFGPDGKLYACQGTKKRVIAYDTNGVEEVLAENLQPNDLATDHNGNLYVTDSPNKKVHLLKAGGKRVVDEGITFPNGVRFSPDQTLLYVADYRGQSIYAFDVQADGSLTNRRPFCHLRMSEGVTQSSADGMTVDSLGRLYVTTEMGIQVCDKSGQVVEVIAKPQPKGPSSIGFGGNDFDTLYAACGDKLFKRKLRARGVLSFQAPIK